MESAAFRYAVVAATAGIGATLLAALVLPWVYYGGVSVRLWDVPGWPVHAGAVVALHLCVAGGLITTTRGRFRLSLTVLGVGAGTASVTSAVVLAVRGHDSGLVFGPVVPPITPVFGPGVLVAIAGVLVSMSSLVAMHRTGGIQRMDRGRRGSPAA